MNLSSDLVNDEQRYKKHEHEIIIIIIIIFVMHYLIHGELWRHM